MKLFKVLGLSLCIVLLIFGLNTLKTSNNLKPENILPAEKTTKNIRYIKTEDIEIATDEWKASPAVCFDSQINDSGSFGFVTAINNKYLAVGDPNTNRVIIYGHSGNNKWVRTKEILPPKNSVPIKVGFGFGRNLAIDGDVLIIVADIQQPNDKVTNPEYFQSETIAHSYFTAVYRTKLNKKTKVERIDLLNKEVIPSNSISANGGKIAFITSGKKQTGQSISQVNILSDDSLIQLPTPESREEMDNFYPSSVFLKDNFLLVGTPYSSSKGFAWLFNLSTLDKKPQKITVPNVTNYTPVALSDEFIVAVGKYLKDTSSEHLYPATLIQAIKSGLITAIEGFDYENLSVDKNFLLRKRFSRAGIDEPNILEIFLIDDNNIPSLIIKRISNRDYFDYAVLQNGFLVTSSQGNNVCIEQLFQRKNY